MNTVKQGGGVNNIDWMKTLGMFFIIWGHLSPEYIKDGIYIFSVPSFFIISGFLFKPSEWRLFLSKNKKGLIVPYFLLTSSVILFFALVKIFFGSFDALYFPQSFLCMLIGDQNGLGNGAGCQAMWFVYTLFLTKVIANATYDKWWLRVFICIASLTAVVYMKAKDIQIYSSFTNVLLAYPFFEFGCAVSHRYMKKLEELPSLMNRTEIIFLLLLGFACLYVMGYYNGMVQMYNADYGNSIILCLIGGVFGTILLAFVGILFNGIDVCDIIAIHSKGTIITLAWQIVFLFTIEQISLKYNIAHLHSVSFSFLLALCIFIAFVPIIKFVNKRLPILVGYRDRIPK